MAVSGQLQPHRHICKKVWNWGSHIRTCWNDIVR